MLDKGAREEQSKNKVVEPEWKIPENIRVVMDEKRQKEFHALVEKISIRHNSQVAEIDKQSKTIGGRIFADKAHNELFKWMLQLDTSTLQNNIALLYGLALVNERLVTIEKTLQEVGKKVNLEMPNLKEQVKYLQTAVKEPMFAEVHSFVKMVKKKIEEGKKAQEDYVE